MNQCRTARLSLKRFLKVAHCHTPPQTKMCGVFTNVTDWAVRINFGLLETVQIIAQCRMTHCAFCNYLYVANELKSLPGYSAKQYDVVRF